jgi:hypothetical protein
MPGPLYFLDGKSADDITAWLRDALRGKTHVPLEYPDQPVAGAISAASPALSDQARRDLDAGVVTLLRGIQNGRPAHPYVGNLLRLSTALDLRKSAVPILRHLAQDMATLAARVGWQTSSEILFALLNLRDLRDPDFWISRWRLNPRCLTPVVMAALFDLNPATALASLPDVPNSEEFGDLVALNLDYAADTYQGHERTRFRESAATAAQRCKSHIRNAIETWLNETAPPARSNGRSLARLHAALGPLPETYHRTPAKLCEAAA